MPSNDILDELITRIDGLRREVMDLQRRETLPIPSSITIYSGTPVANRIPYWTGAGTIAAGSVSYSHSSGTPTFAATSSAGMRWHDDGGNPWFVGSDGGRVGIGGTALGRFHVRGIVGDTGWLGLFTMGTVVAEDSPVLGAAQARSISVQGDGGAFVVLRDNTNDIEFVQGISAANIGLVGMITNHPLEFRINNSAVGRILTGGVWAFGLTSVGATVAGVKAGASTNDAALGGVLYANSTAVGNVDAGENDLMSYSVPADTLSANHMSLQVVARGTFAANGNTKTLKLHFGSDNWTLLSTGANNNRWVVKATIVRTGATAQKVFITFSYSGAVGDTTTYTTASRTLSSANTLKLTGQGTSSNDILQEWMRVDWHDANT